MSASRPKGRRNIAVDNIKLLITHPRLMAFAWRSFPIAGRARLTAELRKGVRNAAKAETSRTALFDVLSSAMPIFILAGYLINYRSLFNFSTHKHSNLFFCFCVYNYSNRAIIH